VVLSLRTTFQARKNWVDGAEALASHAVRSKAQRKMQMRCFNEVAPERKSQINVPDGTAAKIANAHLPP
jgi:hypothetical protein